MSRTAGALVAGERTRLLLVGRTPDGRDAYRPVTARVLLMIERMMSGRARTEHGDVLTAQRVAVRGALLLLALVALGVMTFFLSYQTP